MLLLQNIQVRVSPKLFPSNIRRYLRIGVQNIATNTKNQAKIINQTHIKWQESLSIPVMYGKQFQFQIYEKHQFGYNKQEFEVLLHGKLMISNVQQKFNNWEVFNATNQKVGYLSANIISKSKLKNNSNVVAKPLQQNEAGYKYLYINSIVVHLPDAKLKRAFAEMQIGKETKNSSAVRSRSGQLVFIQGYELEKQNQQFMHLKINELDTRTSQTKLIAKGQLKLQGEKPPKKVLLYDQSDNIIGEAYVESHQSSTRSAQTMAALLQTSRPLVNSSMDQFASPKTSRGQTLSLYGILSRSRITSHNGSKSQYQRLSPLRNKKVSVVNHNNDIVFPKQKRFQIYQDRQSDVVSYLNDRDFRFLNKKTKKYYRGASVGYGDKTDFTKQTTNNPGVGRYHLPSIWDRY